MRSIEPCYASSSDSSSDVFFFPFESISKAFEIGETFEIDETTGRYEEAVDPVEKRIGSVGDEQVETCRRGKCAPLSIWKT